MGHRFKRHRGDRHSSRRYRPPTMVTGVARQGLFLLVALAIVGASVEAGSLLLPTPPQKALRTRNKSVLVAENKNPTVPDTPIEKKNGDTPMKEEPKEEPKEMAKGKTEDPKAVVPPEKPKTEEPKKPEPPKPEPPKPEPPKPMLVVYEKDIMPIFKDKCVVCHGDPSVKGGLDMRTIAAMKKGGDNGPSLVPSDLKKSLIWELITTNEMPPKEVKEAEKRLTEAEKQKIKDWILGGCKDAKDVAAAAAS